MIPWNKGKKLPCLSEEHKQKISQSNIGLKRSEETKEKIRQKRALQIAPNKGRKFSEETKEKMRLAKLGKPSNNKSKNLIH